MVRTEDGVKRSTFVGWGQRITAPSSPISLEILRRIERRYRLPERYFSGVSKVVIAGPVSCELDEMTPAERRRFVWHLPDDFRRRPRTEQAEILSWVRNVIKSGSTEYRRYQAAAIRQRYAVRFQCAASPQRKYSRSSSSDPSDIVEPPNG